MGFDFLGYFLDDPKMVLLILPEIFIMIELVFFLHKGYILKKRLSLCLLGFKHILHAFFWMTAIIIFLEQKNNNDFLFIIFIVFWCIKELELKKIKFKKIKFKKINFKKLCLQFKNQLFMIYIYIVIVKFLFKKNCWKSIVAVLFIFIAPVLLKFFFWVVFIFWNFGISLIITSLKQHQSIVNYTYIELKKFMYENINSIIILFLTGCVFFRKKIQALLMKMLVKFNFNQLSDKKNIERKIYEMKSTLSIITIYLVVGGVFVWYPESKKRYSLSLPDNFNKTSSEFINKVFENMNSNYANEVLLKTIAAILFVVSMYKICNKAEKKLREKNSENITRKLRRQKYNLKAKRNGKF